jgi:serralysin
MVHEIGHAIGLSHPGDYNFAVGRSIDYAKDATYFQDSKQFSIMSYFHAGNTGTKGFVNWATGGYYQNPQTPMVHDIAAVQSLYGADTTTRTGDTTYGFNVTADLADRPVFDFTKNINPFLTIYDAGGHDTLDMSGWSRNFVLDLREGNYSTGWGQPVIEAELDKVGIGNLTQAQWDALFEGRLGSNPGFLSDNIGIAFGTVIEDGITGAGNDRLIGNDVANRLDGGRGNDIYTGNGGDDVFVISGDANTKSTETITDFKSGSDRIDLSAFGINIEDVKFEGKSIFVDVDGDAVTDIIIVSQGEAIAPTDLIFG